MAKTNYNDDNTKKLDTIIELLQHILALELYKSGMSQEVIGKHLRIAKASVVKMVKGVRKERLV